MKKSPLSTPGCHTGNYQHQNRARRGGYGYQPFRSNSNNDHFYSFSRSNNPCNAQFGNEVIPLDSSSPIFYHDRGNRRQFNRHNQRFSNTGVSSSNDNQRNFQNSSSPYKRHSNQFGEDRGKKKEESLKWYRRLPPSEFMDLQRLFENPWIGLEKTISNDNLSNTTSSVDSNSIQVMPEKDGHGDTLSDSNSEEISTDLDNSSRDEHKDGSLLDLQLDGISFNNHSKNESL